MLRIPKIGTALFCAVFLTAALTSAQFIGDDSNTAPTNGRFSNRECYKNNFPQFFGGNQDEQVTCMIHLTNSNVIITGGYTTSNASFAPRKFMNWTEDGEEIYDEVPINQGFMSALNHQGDLVWASYFYNNSYPIYSVTGCKTNPSQSMVIAMGLAQVGNLTTVSRPYLMTVD